MGAAIQNKQNEIRNFSYISLIQKHRKVNLFVVAHAVASYNKLKRTGGQNANIINVLWNNYKNVLQRQ